MRRYDVQGMRLLLYEHGEGVKSDVRDDFKEEMKLMREDWKTTLKAMEDRLAADRKETADRLAADRKDAEIQRKESEARLEHERKESEARLERERIESRRDFNSHRRWLVATFVAVVVGMFGIFIAVLISIVAAINGYLPFTPA